jgi:O-antigen ligase
MRGLRLEHWALVGLAATLPLYEFPKGVFHLLYVFLWLGTRIRERDFGGPWDRWDTLIALWVASGYASIVFAGIAPYEWREGNDLARYASVLWCLKRSRYSEPVLRAVFYALAGGTLVTLLWGYYEIIKPLRHHNELRLWSVGHVNHSAIYLAIVFGATLAATRAFWPHSRGAARAGWLGLTAFFGASLFVMQSRGALAAAFVTALFVLGAFSIRYKAKLRVLALGALVVVIAVLAARPDVLDKVEERLHEGQLLAHRDSIWRTGVAAFRANPVFGVGIEHYGRIRPEHVRRWETESGRPFQSERFLFSPHAHSLYVNALAERGSLGFAALLAVLVGWAVAVLRHVPAADADATRWIWWGGATSAWLVTALVGFVNTTLHHEHALLATILLGGWLCLARAQRPPG